MRVIHLQLHPRRHLLHVHCLEWAPLSDLHHAVRLETQHRRPSHCPDPIHLQLVYRRLHLQLQNSPWLLFLPSSAPPAACDVSLFLLGGVSLQQQHLDRAEHRPALQKHRTLWRVPCLSQACLDLRAHCPPLLLGQFLRGGVRPTCSVTRALPIHLLHIYSGRGVSLLPGWPELRLVLQRPALTSVFAPLRNRDAHSWIYHVRGVHGKTERHQQYDHHRVS